MSFDLVTIALFILGMIFGSFAAAQVWRIRARQLVEDQDSGEEVDLNELKSLNRLIVSAKNDHSMCLKCHHRLSWYDLVPLFSWLSTAGRCRYCRRPIGAFEPAMEIGLGVLFAVSYTVLSPSLTSFVSIVLFIIWLIACVIMSILFAYDAKWFLLPEGLNIALGGLGFVYALLVLSQDGITLGSVLSLAGSLAIMSGLYLLIFIISSGKWIGFGDVLLGIGLGFLLIEWQNAFIALFLANVLGLIAVIPGYLAGNVGGKTQIPFGPFLIAGTVITVLWGDRVMVLANDVLNSFMQSLL